MSRATVTVSTAATWIAETAETSLSRVTSFKVMLLTEQIKQVTFPTAAVIITLPPFTSLFVTVPSMVTGTRNSIPLDVTVVISGANVILPGSFTAFTAVIPRSKVFSPETL